MDECLTETDNCDHLCINNEGGFDCSCQPGYRLDFDQHSCEGRFINNVCMLEKEKKNSTEQHLSMQSLTFVVINSDTSVNHICLTIIHLAI